MRLYLVDVYQIVENKTINIISIKDMSLFGIKENTVLTVQVNPIKNKEELELCKETAASVNTNYSTVGVVIKNNLGQRYKFRNPNYEHVRRLRGNQPKLQFQYLNLRQAPKDNEYQTQSKLTEYLKYYPEHKAMFNEFRNILHTYTNGLFTNYISCYIKKEKELKNFPEKYRTHMYNLHHEVFLKELLPKKSYVTKAVVIGYFNGLHPAKQMYVLNYDVRKNYIAKEKFDNSKPVESSTQITDESQ
jgi:hypothetical protein